LIKPPDRGEHTAPPAGRGRCPGDENMELREFKAKYLAKLLNLKKQLVEKYPERAERINYITDLLASKLENLRTFTLPDYLFTLHLATKEFPELEQLIPSEQEIDELLKGGE
jgi:hypothetical protein